MTRTLILGGTVLTPDQSLPGQALVIEAGRIAAVESHPELLVEQEGDQVIQADGMLVAPGLIDLHVHGSAGSDAMDATPEAISTMANYFVRHGVTTFLPTTVTGSARAIQAAVENLAGGAHQQNGARPLGVHLEGPYLSAGHKGAQPEEHMRPADPQEYTRWFESGVVRLVAVAPEIPGVLDMISSGIQQGIRFAVGHSGATFDQVMQAVGRGLNQATHTFNGMTGLHHREPGTAGAVLADERIYAEVIADGIHLHPAVVRIIVRAKGIDRTILITDAIRAAGLEDGQYDLGGHLVNVRGGIARTDSGSLAGSTLTLDAAVRNVIRFAGVSLNQALAMATRVPAEAMGWAGKKGALQPGADADLVLFDQELTVRATFIEGQLVYSSL